MLYISQLTPPPNPTFAIRPSAADRANGWPDDDLAASNREEAIQAYRLKHGKGLKPLTSR